MQDIDARLFLAGSILLIAVALVVVGLALWREHARQQRNRHLVDRALASRDTRLTEAYEREMTRESRARAAMKMADDMGARLGEGRFADSLLADEDRQLVDMCGFENVPRARSRFIAARVVLMLLLPILFCVAAEGHFSAFAPLLKYAMAVFFGVALGYLIPKWTLLRRASRRKRAAQDELPLLIDLLKLLQGVGLSMDQSLHTVVNDFGHVMPVLAGELRLSSEVHARGRTREQSLQRMATSFDNDDLSAICKLIVQVDRHGGAVQEPLARFGERVREKRKMDMKEQIGKLTVKMTGVMVVTLLPGLVIITGGAGFLAVIRGLSRVSGG